jgi:1A family penicillin-binding protein
LNKKAAIAVLKGGTILALGVISLFLLLVIFLPLPESTVPQATRVYDANGEIISTLFIQNRVSVPSSDIPKALKDATVAVEDKRFFNHHGIDLESILRAIVTNIKAGKILQGGSTITQQLAKELYLTQERTFRRKFIEAVYTVKLEMRYTKDEILTMYLNQIYFGHGNYGCQLASKAYFGKDVKDLTVAESALLAGIIRSPEYYSPYRDMDIAVERREIVLDLMVQQGYLTESEKEELNNQQIELAGLPKQSAPYFIDYVLAQIREKHPEIGNQIYRGGYEIHTTLDLHMQNAAEAAFQKHIPQGEKDSLGITQPQGALVAIEPSTGHIKALVGGRDWDESQLNRAYQVRRQPGSAFKIFLYAAVIDQAHPVTETKVCEPVEYPGRTPDDAYSPVDYGSKPYHYAPLDIRTAVTISDNVVATRWAQEISPSTVVDYARRMGVYSPLEPNIPLVLGASEVTPMEMVVASATISAGGIRPEPISILRIVDASGNVIEENQVERHSVLDPGTCYILTSTLRSVLGPYGTGDGLQQAFLGNRPAAGKTGTSDDEKEAWFVGYTPDLACAVYVGWDNREKSLPGTGAAVAGPIWAEFIGEALRNRPTKEWPLPDNVSWVQICGESKLLAGPFCVDRYYEVFRKDSLPPEEPWNYHLPNWGPWQNWDNWRRPGAVGEITPPEEPATRPHDLPEVPVVRAQEAPALPILPSTIPGLKDFLHELVPD